MGLLKRIADHFNGTAKPSEGAVRRSVARMKTREGRLKYLKLISLHPDVINYCDKRGKSALFRATEAADTEVMERIIEAGINRCTYHESIDAAAHSGGQAALDTLMKHGAVVTQDHVHLAGEMLLVMTEFPERGIDPKPYERALELLKTAYEKQEEKRVADEAFQKNVGPLVLADKISVKGPLKLRGANKSAFTRRLFS